MAGKRARKILRTDASEPTSANADEAGKDALIDAIIYSFAQHLDGHPEAKHLFIESAAEMRRRAADGDGSAPEIIEDFQREVDRIVTIMRSRLH